MKPVAGAMVGLVRVYQRVVAPWLPPSCRFTPSCSAYMIEALKTHGPVRGAWLGFKRILRCSPLCAHGFDPVPPAGASALGRRGDARRKEQADPSRPFRRVD